VSPGRRSVSQADPGPAADTTTVTRPSSAVLIAIDRRSSSAEVSPPTANATNCPGWARSAISGAAIVSST
jgi:hypothetical protein